MMMMIMMMMMIKAADYNTYWTEPVYSHEAHYDVLSNIFMFLVVREQWRRKGEGACPISQSTHFEPSLCIQNPPKCRFVI